MRLILKQLKYLLAGAVVESSCRLVAQKQLGVLGKRPCYRQPAKFAARQFVRVRIAKFSETDRFERVLLMETRRMRKVGSTIVVAARLNGHMVDAMIRMRKMGPYVRLYLVTFTPDDPAVVPMVSKLQQGDVEVRYVRPEQM